MANPQREDGHIDIANEITEYLAKTQLSGYESRILWGLLRETWGRILTDNKGRMLKDNKGWPLKKKTASIGAKRWHELTGLNRHNVWRTLRSLELRRIVIRNDNNNAWGFQKNYHKWLPPVKEIVIRNDNTYFVTKNDNTFIKIDNKILEIDNIEWRKAVSKEGVPQPKESLKESIKKERRSTTVPTPKIVFNFDNYEWENISEKDKKQWQKAYPACDIEAELRKMGDWLVSNPKKRKVNYRRFITNWLITQQDKGGSRDGKTATYPRKDTREGWEESNKYREIRQK